MIRKVESRDANAIASIYNYYVKNEIATFEEVPVSVEYFQNNIASVTKQFPWLVFEENGQVLGYAYANIWKTRSAYNKSVEVSVYLKHGLNQRGIGSQLYKELIAILKREGFHVLIGGISLPNEASVRLHEKFGFEKVAHFKQIGYKFNTWVDVGYWQLTLNK